MKSKINGLGETSDLSFTEPDEMYCDQRVHVRLPSDSVEDLAKLSGPVIKYNLMDIKNNENGGM